MKYFLILISAFILFNTARAQNDERAADFISQVINEPGIVYTDSVGLNAIRNLWGAVVGKGFRKSKEDSLLYVTERGRKIRISAFDVRRYNDQAFANRVVPYYIDSLILSEKEKDYITAQINNIYHYKWRANLIPDSKLMPVDTLRKLYTNKYFNKWADLDKKGIKRIYTIAPPIFLRNATFCFFYYDYDCGHLCAWGEFAIYKKVNGKWAKWLQLSSWES